MYVIKLFFTKLLAYIQHINDIYNVSKYSIYLPDSNKNKQFI